MSRTLVIAALVGALVIAAAVLVRTGGPAGHTSLATGSGALAAFSAYEDSGDLGRLQAADDLTRDALAADPTDLLAIETAARVALARQEYADALALADRAVARAPHRAVPDGLRADALLALGRYEEAFPIVDSRLRLRPDLPAYARASWAAELQGDVDAARVLMRLAADTAPAGSSGRRWADSRLIEINLRYGRLGRAEELIARAEVEHRSGGDLALHRGRLAVARGELLAARRVYRRAAADRPTADLLAELAEIEHALGADERAAERLAETSAALARDAEHRDNALERLAFGADWSVPGPGEVAAAREARRRQPSVIGDSVLAWVLARSGQCDEAAELARRSLRLGYRDPLARFRAAFAQACAGHRAAAQEIAADLIAETPHFSPRWASTAREIAVGAAPSLPGSPSMDGAVQPAVSSSISPSPGAMTLSPRPAASAAARRSARVSTQWFTASM